MKSEGGKFWSYISLSNRIVDRLKQVVFWLKASLIAIELATIVTVESRVATTVVTLATKATVVVVLTLLAV